MDSRESKIVFRAYRNKVQQPIKVTPLQKRNSGGKHYTGQGKSGFFETLTKDEKDEFSSTYLITPDTSVTIIDGKTLDLDDPIDAANWKWIKKHPYINVEGKKNPTRDMVFYIEDKKTESEEFIRKDELITKAKSKMYDASVEELNNVAKSLGFPSPEQFSSAEVKKYVIDIIDVSPQSVLDAFNPENKVVVNLRSLLFDLSRHNIIVQSRGSYYYGGENGTHLGRSEQQVIEFMSTDENQALVEAMMSQLEEKTAKGELVNG